MLGCEDEADCIINDDNIDAMAEMISNIVGSIDSEFNKSFDKGIKFILGKAKKLEDNSINRLTYYITLELESGKKLEFFVAIDNMFEKFIK